MNSLPQSKMAVKDDSASKLKTPLRNITTRGKKDALLDLLSTSQKIEYIQGKADISERLKADISEDVQISHFVQAEKCDNGAPYLCYKPNGLNHWNLVQGCCNSWTCKRCGQIRARTEYGRIVNGAYELGEAGHDLYFITITCRGKEMSLRDAERHYLTWTNRLLTTMRARAKKQGDQWFYAAVTERQKRGHPHSHILTTFCPDDVVAYAKDSWLPNGAKAKHDTLYSQWFVDRNISAGLGKMCDITKVRSPVAAASYLSKYFFKDSLQTVWPSGWKRVRYSRNWPKLPFPTDTEAFALVKLSDWHQLEHLEEPIYAQGQVELEAAYARLVTCVMPSKSLNGGKTALSG